MSVINVTFVHLGDDVWIERILTTGGRRGYGRIIVTNGFTPCVWPAVFDACQIRAGAKAVTFERVAGNIGEDMTVRCSWCGKEFTVRVYRKKNGRLAMRQKDISVLEEHAEEHFNEV